MTMRGQTTSRNYFNATLEWLKEDRHYFKITKYNAWVTEVVADNQNILKGNLVEVKPITYKYKDTRGIEQIGKKIQFTIEQDWEQVNLQMYYNKISRAMVYALASSDTDLWEVEFSLYISKKGNKGCRVKNNGKDLMSKFDFEKDIKAKCTYSEQFKMYDYSKLDERIDWQLIPGINLITMYKPTNEEVKEEEKKEEFNDLPF